MASNAQRAEQLDFLPVILSLALDGGAHRAHGILHCGWAYQFKLLGLKYYGTANHIKINPKENQFMGGGEEIEEVQTCFLKWTDDKFAFVSP